MRPDPSEQAYDHEAESARLAAMEAEAEAKERRIVRPEQVAAEAAAKRDYAFADAARAFGELCAVATDALERFTAQRLPSDPEPPAEEEPPWACPRCGGRMQALRDPGGDDAWAEPIYGCARGHALVRADAAAQAKEQGGRDVD